MRFVYKAKKGAEEIVEGNIEAANQDAAVAKIIEAGLVPVSVKEEGEYVTEEATRPKTKKTQSSISFSRRVTKKDVYIFTKKLKTLLKSQLPILSSLCLLEDQVTSGRFKGIVTEIVETVKEGSSFSEALGKFPKHFPPLYVSIIKAGEASGKLDNSLEQIAKYMDDEMLISQKVKSSLAYPAMMLAVGVATIIFVMTFVIPKLKVLFEGLSESLPLITKVLLGVSVFFSRYWLALFGLSAISVAFLIYTRDSSWQRKALTAVKKRTPIVKDIVYDQSLCRFARGLSLLLASGVPILQAIETATPLVDDPASQDQISKAYKQILAGSGLEESMRNNCHFLPDMFIKMVAVGEASGRLDEILGEMAESYADNVDSATKIMTSLVEPIAILLVGGALGFIAIAILLPIFDISSAVH